MPTPLVTVLARPNYETSNSNLYSLVSQLMTFQIRVPVLTPLAMPDISITTQGIVNFLNDLKIYKASGPDTISARILIETSDIITPILQIVF